MTTKGGGPDLEGLFEQAQQIQKDFEEQLAEKTIEGEAGGGLVKVLMNARQQVVKVTIDRQAVDPEDVGMLEDLIVTAMNQALEKVKQIAAEQIGKMTKGLNIPGLF